MVKQKDTAPCVYVYVCGCTRVPFELKVSSSFLILCILISVPFTPLKRSALSNSKLLVTAKLMISSPLLQHLDVLLIHPQLEAFAFLVLGSTAARDFLDCTSSIWVHIFICDSCIHPRMQALLESALGPCTYIWTIPSSTTDVSDLPLMWSESHLVMSNSLWPMDHSSPGFSVHGIL